jgi:DNA processing protein
MDELKYLLALNSVPSLGPVKSRNLLEHFGSPREIFTAPDDELTKVARIGEIEVQNIRTMEHERIAEEQYETARKTRARIIPYSHPDYPEEMKVLYAPPLILYCRGAINPSSKRSIAIVGSRRISPYGREATIYFAQGLAGSGFTVISGLARGVDSIAHRATLDRGAKTVAVLGCGLDVVYPPENGELFDEIAEKGLIITEYPFHTPPEATNFPRRNRIIAALSGSVLITEAGKGSGALLTAKYALQQKKPLFVVPANVNTATSLGSNRMLRNGARAVLTMEDLMTDLEINEPVQEITPATVKLPDKEGLVYSTLSLDPQHVDQISCLCRLPAAETLTLLLSMELKGLVQQLAGKMFVKAVTVKTH